MLEWVLPFSLLIFLLLVVGFYTQKKTLAPSSSTPQQPTDTTSFLEIKDFKVFYQQAGSGPDVLLLHGIGASSYTWRLLLPLLSRHYRVTAVDLPGFGKSTKNVSVSYGLDAQVERLIEIMDRLRISQAHLVGSSMGGAIALWLARKYPERVLHLALISPAASQGLVHYDFFKHARIGTWVTPFVGPRIGRRILNYVYHDRNLITAETVEKYMEPYMTDPASVVTFIKAVEALRDARLPIDLSQIQCKVALLYGEQDLVIRKKHMEKVRSSFVAAPQYFSHPTLGHHPMEEDPQWVFECLRTFF
ncbi:MAG: alpha/beta fold hydrolase [Bdellovibrionales bacterium]